MTGMRLDYSRKEMERKEMNYEAFTLIISDYFTVIMGIKIQIFLIEMILI